MSESHLESGAASAPRSAAKSAKADQHFVRKFAGSMPAHIAKTFTDAQLRADGVGSWGQHAIDFRFTLPVMARTYYFVFLAGVDKRPRSRNRAERHSHPMATVANFLFLFLVLLLLVSFILGAFYVLKLAFGLNVAPGFSLGVWDSIQSELGGP